MRDYTYYQKVSIEKGGLYFTVLRGELSVMDILEDIQDDGPATRFDGGLAVLSRNGRGQATQIGKFECYENGYFFYSIIATVGQSSYCGGQARRKE